MNGATVSRGIWPIFASPVTDSELTRGILQNLLWKIVFPGD